jgi:hypothetical protein
MNHPGNTGQLAGEFIAGNCNFSARSGGFIVLAGGFKNREFSIW